MDAKLTLNLDKGVKDRAKVYAKSQEISHSRLIENYLAALTSPGENSIELTPLVQSLTGMVELKEDFLEKEEYGKYLSKKYS